MRKIYGLIVVLLLAGCSVKKAYHRPPAPIASLWPTAAQPEDSAIVPPVDLGWHRIFPDPCLQELINLSLVHNRDLRIAIANIAQARALYRIQEFELFPIIDTTLSRTVQRTPPALLVSGGPTVSRQDQLEVGFTTFELDVFGRLRCLKDAALEQYLATEEVEKSVHITLVAEVASAYFSWLADKMAVTIFHGVENNLEQIYDLVRLSFETGTASKLDLYTSETQLEDARTQLAQGILQVQQDENALTLLIGTPIPHDLPVPEEWDSQGVMADIPAGLPSDLLERRPDILAAEHQLKSAHANVNAARAAFFPQIELTGLLGTASAHLGGLFGKQSQSWVWMPQISAPIFNYGLLQADYAEIKAIQDAAIAQYEKAIQTAFREVADALAARSSLQLQVAARESQLGASSESFSLIALRQQEGIDSLPALLAAQNDLYSAEQLLLQVELTRLIQRVTLYKALGGGWLQ